ncbi:MAG: hypothetical protein HY748_05370 [Elusimicrobia bacterium]|nr:hypothetical protein [Elusimicrobiota bacterium]
MADEASEHLSIGVASPLWCQTRGIDGRSALTMALNEFRGKVRELVGA